MEASPQWTAPSSEPDRAEWTAADRWVPEQRSWFEQPVDRAEAAPAWTPPAQPPAPADQTPAWTAAQPQPSPVQTQAWTAAQAQSPGEQTQAWGPAQAAAPLPAPAEQTQAWDPAATQAWSPAEARAWRPAAQDRAAATPTGAGAGWGPGAREVAGQAGAAGATRWTPETAPEWSPQSAAELTGPIDLGSEPPLAQWGAPAEPAGPGHAPAGATRAPAGPRAHAVKHPLRLALFALVLVGLVAGSAAWLTMDKSVRLTVDGEARTVSTYASTVSGVLDDAGVTVSDHDTLAPAKDAKISDGAEIVLRRGRQVTLTVDGTPRKVWVTATTVEEALSQVGYRQDGLFVSANRSTRLPLEGYELTLRTPKRVTIVADGRKHPITTTAPTVGEAMAQAAVTVDADDRVSQLAEAVVRPGMTVTVTRVSTRTRTVETVVQFETIEQTDPKAAVDSRTVKTKGVTGLRQVTKVETYVDGTLTSSKVAKVTVLRQPVDEVVVVGPEAPEPPPTTPTQPAGCAAFPTTGGLNWCGLAKCESGLNPNAYNPAGPYYGLYQFDQGTWTSNGGSGSPSGKSIAEQTAVAYNLYQARGASPWPVCGRNL